MFKEGKCKDIGKDLFHIKVYRFRLRVYKYPGQSLVRIKLRAYNTLILSLILTKDLKIIIKYMGKW